MLVMNPKSTSKCVTFVHGNSRRRPASVLAPARGPTIEGSNRRLLVDSIIDEPPTEPPVDHADNSYFVIKELKAQLQAQADKLNVLKKELATCRIESQKFVAAMSHDLKAPIRAIAGFSGYLKEELQGTLDEVADDYLTRIVNSSSLLRDQITSLVILSRVEFSDCPLELVDMAAAFNFAKSKLADQMHSSGAKVTQQGLPTVFGVRTQLIELMQNLIENGIKFNSNSTPAVHVASQREGDHWRITFSDNGIGIDKKHHECVFDTFRQLNEKGTYAGVGAGLTICRKIVHRHSGKIWLESEPAESNETGTVVSLSIPAAC